MRPRDGGLFAAALFNVEKADEKRCAERERRGGSEQGYALLCCCCCGASALRRCDVVLRACHASRRACERERAGIFFARSRFTLSRRCPALLEAVSILVWVGLAYTANVISLRSLLVCVPKYIFSNRRLLLFSHNFRVSHRSDDPSSETCDKRRRPLYASHVLVCRQA